MTASERIREARSNETRNLMDAYFADVRAHAASRLGISLNYYGQPITDPAQFHDAHTVNPMGKGLPPVCSCGWTPHGQFTMADHLADMGEYVNGSE